VTLDPAPQDNSPDSSAEIPDDFHTDRITEAVERMAPTLRRVAWALLRDWQLADDATQEAFVLFTQRVAEIAPDSQDGWLVRTVQLKSLTIRRSAYRQQKLIVKLKDFAATKSTQGEAGLANDTERTNKLKNAIDQLPAEQREVVLLRLQDEHTFADIAEKLERPLSTVLSRMRLALEKLAKRFNEDDH
jgi:RNA polymerase sigma-70 factor (ECF subfamily)